MFVLLYSLSAVLLSLVPLAWPSGLFIMILAIGPVFYAAFNYPQRVYLFMIVLAVLLEVMDTLLLARDIPGTLLLIAIMAVSIGLLSNMAHNLLHSRLRVERALTQSEDRYRSFVLHFQGLAYQAGLDLRPVFFHGPVQDLTGYPAEDFITGKLQWDDLILPEDRQLVTGSRAALLEKANFSSERDYRIQRKDGQIRWIHEMIQNMVDENNRVTGIQASLLDITASKQTEQALRENEQRYRGLFESMQEGFALNEPMRDEAGRVVNFRVLDANPAIERIFASAGSSLTGRTISELFPTVYQEWLTVYQDVLETGQARRVNGYLEQLNKFLEVIFFRPWPGQVATIAMDITARKQIENALQESQAHFRSMFENSPISLWDEDLSHIKRMVDERKARGVRDFHTYLHDHPEEIARFSRALVVNDVNQASLRLMRERSKEDLLKSIRTVLGSYTSGGLIEAICAIAEGKTNFVWEGPNDLLDGEERYHRITWAVTPGNERTYARVIVAIEDVTESRHVQEALLFLSSHDTLTGLFNRAFFDAEMERLKISRLFPISIFFVDMDGLKSVNDTLGHAVGDDLLRRAAVLLRSAFRAEDVVARIGGDEFGVLLPGASQEVALEAMRRIRRQMEMQNTSQNGPPVRFSVGIATADHGDDLAEVLRQADEDMYINKLKRGNVR